MTTNDVGRRSVSGDRQAFRIETDGTKTPVTARQVERWSDQERRGSLFQCAGCLTPVIPWNMDSSRRSPTFSIGPKGGPHSHGCDPDAPTDGTHGSHARTTSLTGRSVGVPHRLVLIDRSVRVEDPDHVDAESDVDAERRRRSRATDDSVVAAPGGRSRNAHALGHIVDTWLDLSTATIRRAEPLDVPGVDTDTYLTVFKRISAFSQEIPTYAPRIFYSALRFTRDRVQDGSILTLTLQPEQHATRRQFPILCTLAVDRTGWPVGRSNALDRELDWAYAHARASWRTDKTSAMHVFALAQQHPDDPTVFQVDDPRLIYLTDEKITH